MRLKLNVCLLHASRQKLITIPKEPNVVISRNIIERVETYKCLGLGLDESLTWEYHISSIISKVCRVFNSLIQPHFDYCSIIRDNLGKGLGQMLPALTQQSCKNNH